MGISPSWGVANVTAVTFNYILVKLSLFPLNVDVSPHFHETVLAPVYRLNLPVSLIQLLVPITGYMLSVWILQVLLLF